MGGFAVGGGAMSRGHEGDTVTRQTLGDQLARTRWQHIFRCVLVLAVVLLLASAVPWSSGHPSPEKTWLRIISLVVIVSLLALRLYREAAKRSDQLVFSLERNRWLIITLFGPSFRRLLAVAVLFLAVFLAHLIANFILYGRLWQ